MVSSPFRSEGLDIGRRVAVQASENSEAEAVAGLLAKLSPQFIGVCGRGNSFFDQHIIGGLDPSPSARAFFWFCVRPLAACDDARSAALCERATLAMCSFFQRAASFSALHPPCVNVFAINGRALLLGGELLEHLLVAASASRASAMIADASLLLW